MKATTTPLDRAVMGGLSEMLTCSQNLKGKESEPDKNRERKGRGGEGREASRQREPNGQSPFASGRKEFGL